MNILIIDDSATARLFAKKCLLMTIPSLKDDSNFFESKDGEEALKLLQQIKIDLILSDVNMPVMSGFTFLRNMKRDEKIKNIPIIFITSLANDERRSNLMTLGASEVIGKPIKPVELASAVKKILNNEEKPNSEQQSSGWGE